MDHCLKGSYPTLRGKTMCGGGGWYVHQGRQSEEGEFPYQTLKAGSELATQKGAEEKEACQA